MSAQRPVVVIGGGISGLVCAYTLRKAGIDVVLLEASERAGGVIRSERSEGFLVELGPQSFTGTPAIHTLCSELGIDGEVVEAPASLPRYVLVDGKLQAVPRSPLALLKSPLLGIRTKLSLAHDAIGRSQAPDEDESIAQFVRRKFTAELLDRLVDPFVSGIYAGDIEQLSLRSAFPQVYDAEKFAGSVIRGIKRAAEKSEKRTKPTLLNFRVGMETLVAALREKLGESFRVAAEVQSITREAKYTPFTLRVRDANGAHETLAANQVVVATPAWIAASLLSNVNAKFWDLAIQNASMGLLSLGFKRPDVTNPLHGFGFLVPRSLKIRTLGAVWNSSLFEGRSPQEHVLLTAFVGGATDRGAALENPALLIAGVLTELKDVLGITGAMTFSRWKRYPQALPQYNLGHSARLVRVEAARKETPGLWLAGNYLRGPSIGACVEQSQAVAQDVLSHLAR